MKRPVMSYVLGAVAIALCCAFGLILAFGLTPNSGPLPGWGIAVYLLITTTVPAVASLFLHRFWVFGAISFSWIFVIMGYMEIVRDGFKDLNQWAPLFGYVVLSLAGSWVGSRLVKLRLPNQPEPLTQPR
jgi:hypothetical protein